MLARDTHRAKVSSKHQDSQAIIYEKALFILLETKHQLQNMVRNGEIELTTAELNQGLCKNVQKLASTLKQQITAADLWQAEDKCPQCELRLMPLSEICLCGFENSNSDRLKTDDLICLIPDNCTE
jgi:hypothetical protein